MRHNNIKQKGHRNMDMYYVTVRNNITRDVKTWTLDVSDLVTNVTQHFKDDLAESLVDFDILMIERKF